jgi:CBS domain-containing protein
MTIGRICTREVDLADPDESVQVAANRMNARNVGTLVVIDEDKRPIGILTDRDLAVRVVGKGLDPGATAVSAIMSPAPDTVTENSAIEAAISTMRRLSHRRLPVVDDDGHLVGLISLDDILDLLSEEFTEIGKLVRKEGPSALAAAANTG